jgi:3'(2'), 5'-bisphosphate nucleotidase
VNSIGLKPDQSPVTVADFAVQALVAYRLREAFPEDPIVAEEDAAALRTPAGAPVLESVRGAVQRVVPTLNENRVLELIDRGRGAPAERVWTLDPVDGTQGFVRGDQYVVALALMVRGQVVLGLIGSPVLPLNDRRPSQMGWIACAVRGRGAFATSLCEKTFRRLRVSACRDPHAARVLRSFEATHIDLARFNVIVETLGIETPPALMDGQAKHALIAAGRADLLIRVPATKTFRDKLWDQAAGALIIEEAGGRVTDLNGLALDFSTGRLLTANEGVIASNGLLHDAVLDAIRRVTMKP